MSGTSSHGENQGKQLSRRSKGGREKFLGLQTVCHLTLIVPKAHFEDAKTEMWEGKEICQRPGEWETENDILSAEPVQRSTPFWSLWSNTHLKELV